MAHLQPDFQSPAEIISDNQDLLTETILLRLPAKPLIRLQLVSKNWHSLISQHSFSRLHARLGPKPRTSFIIRPNSTAFFYFCPNERTIYPFEFESIYGKILQSCNGLLLLESRNSQYGRKSYSIHNPTTNQSRIVDPTGRHPSIPGVSLAFDPSKSPHFKIVFVYSPSYSVEVYDSKTGRCTSFNEPFPRYTNTHFNNGIYWNNRIYWFRPTSKSYYFDLETGLAGIAPVMKTPPRRRGEINKNYIIESGGRVHCVSTYSRPTARFLLVFELAENGDDSGWFEVCRVDLDQIAIFLHDGETEFSVLGFVREETVEESTVFFHVPGKVVRFGLRERRFEVVLDLTEHFVCDERHLQCSRHETFQFVESLAPVWCD